MDINDLLKYERITFLGDSITHNHFFITNFYCFLNKKYPNNKLRIYNCGIAGSRIEEGLEIFDTDFMVTKPELAFVMFGMNDSKRDYLPYGKSEENDHVLNEALKDYEKNLDILVKRIQSNGIDVVLCTPTPYDEFNKSEEPFLVGCFELIKKYALIVKNYGEKHNILVINFFDNLAEIVKSDKEIIKIDHVHPTEKGHQIMTKVLLDSFGENYDGCEWNDLFKEYYKKTVLLRDLFACEFLVVGQHISNQEKIDKANEYLLSGDKKSIYYPYFTDLCKRYISLNGDKEKLFEEINYIIDSLSK